MLVIDELWGNVQAGSSQNVEQFYTEFWCTKSTNTASTCFGKLKLESIYNDEQDSKTATMKSNAPTSILLTMVCLFSTKHCEPDI